MHLTVAAQISLEEFLKGLWRRQVGVDLAEVVVGGDVVLWIPHHVDHLTQKQPTLGV